MHVTYNIVRIDNSELMLTVDAPKEVAVKWFNHYRINYDQYDFRLVVTEDGHDYQSVN